MTIDPVMLQLASGPSDEAAYGQHLAASGLKPKTITTYLRWWRRADAWCRMHGFDLATAPPTVIAGFAQTVPPTHGSRSHLRAALVRYWEMIGRTQPPGRAVIVPPQPAGFCKAITEAEALQLEQAAWSASGREGLAVLVGLYLGLRVAEIAAAHWSRFDHQRIWYTCTGKGDRTRKIPVAAPLQQRLETWPGPQAGWMFRGSAGRYHVHPTTVWGWVRELALEAGLPPLHTHQLRHTAIATIHDATGDLAVAQEFAGHARPETTRIYTRVPNRKLLDAAALLDYGGGGFDDAA